MSAATIAFIVLDATVALLLIPIATIAATTFGVSPAPALMCLSVATSASLLTPVPTPVNTMARGWPATGSATAGGSDCR